MLIDVACQTCASGSVEDGCAECRRRAWAAIKAHTDVFGTDSIEFYFVLSDGNESQQFAMMMDEPKDTGSGAMLDSARRNRRTLLIQFQVHLLMPGTFEVVAMGTAQPFYEPSGVVL